MGRYLTKRMFLVLTLTPILLLLLISSSYGASFNSTETGVCTTSKEGRIQPFVSEGKSPKSAYLEFKDLIHCKVFDWKTCCSASEMHNASLAVENLATSGEAVKDCLDLFELLECSICRERLRICVSFCDKVFKACSDAYFTSDASIKVIVPCGSSEGIICGKASNLVSNGTEFCNALGFTVQISDDSVEEPCYGSKSSLEPGVKSLFKTKNFSWFQNLLKLVREMTLAQQNSWVVTLLVIGKKLFIRWRHHQQIQAMIQRDARRLIRGMNGIA